MALLGDDDQDVQERAEQAVEKANEFLQDMGGAMPCRYYEECGESFTDPEEYEIHLTRIHGHASHEIEGASAALNAFKGRNSLGGFLVVIGVFLGLGALWFVGVPLSVVAVLGGLLSAGLAVMDRPISRNIYVALGVLPLWALSTANAVLSFLAGDIFHFGFGAMLATALLTTYYMLPEGIDWLPRGGGGGFAGMLDAFAHIAEWLFMESESVAAAVPKSFMAIPLLVGGVGLVGGLLSIDTGVPIFGQISGFVPLDGLVFVLSITLGLMGPFALYWFAREEHHHKLWSAADRVRRRGGGRRRGRSSRRAATGVPRGGRSPRQGEPSGGPSEERLEEGGVTEGERVEDEWEEWDEDEWEDVPVTDIEPEEDEKGE